MGDPPSRGHSSPIRGDMNTRSGQNSPILKGRSPTAEKAENESLKIVLNEAK